jgi:hypothetical protein
LRLAGLTAGKAKDYDPINTAGDEMAFNLEFTPAFSGTVSFRSGPVSHRSAVRDPPALVPRSCLAGTSSARVRCQVTSRQSDTKMRSSSYSTTGTSRHFLTCKRSASTTWADKGKDCRRVKAFPPMSAPPSSASDASVPLVRRPLLVGIRPHSCRVRSVLGPPPVGTAITLTIRSARTLGASPATRRSAQHTSRVGLCARCLSTRSSC